MHATGSGDGDGGGVRRPPPAAEIRGAGRPDGPDGRDAAAPAGLTTPDR